jgi:predicted nucleotidyltransferase
MVMNTILNREAIRKIAIALGDMNEQVVFVGGATIGLYINDPAADDVRPTKDVDISFAISSFVGLESIRKELNRKGFKQSPEDDVICRFRYEGIKVDVMSTKAVGWAPANPWFSPGFAKRETIVITDQKIQILPLPFFLASKFTAYNDRGGKDPRISHDFEDIIYVLDNRTDIVEQLVNLPDEVGPFLMEQLIRILDDRDMQEAILGNLSYETREERYQRIIECIKQIVAGIQ